MLNKNDRIYVTGSRGMVGSSIFNILKKKNLKLINTHKKIDLTNKLELYNFLKRTKPTIIINAAAVVGGIYENNRHPVKFLKENLEIQNNIINLSFENKINKLIFLGSSCVYPIKNQLIREDDLLSGPLEKTNQWYAIAKIAGIKLCQAYNTQFKTDYRCLMPTNLFGIQDNFKGADAHVIPALIEKFNNAVIKNKKFVKIWGSGNAKREFLYVDDLSAIIYEIMKVSKNKFFKITNNTGTINIGSEYECSIKDVANKLKKISNFNGKLIYEKDKLEGVKRKKLDLNNLKKIIPNFKTEDFETSLRKVYSNYIAKI